MRCAGYKTANIDLEKAKHEKQRAMIIRKHKEKYGDYYHKI
jgi:hypothetical protein